MQKALEEDLAQKRKQVLTLRQSMDKQNSTHVRASAARSNCLVQMQNMIGCTEPSTLVMNCILHMHIMLIDAFS